MSEKPTTDAVPDDAIETPVLQPEPPREIGGPKEADPTRYGDWTVKGRCIDF